jgi:hypothetical protein
MDSTEHRLASGRRAFANTGGETLMREELAKLVANVIDGVDPDTPADIDGSERILVAANLVTLARTAVEFDYRGDVVDAHAPEAPTRFAKQLTQVMRGAIAIGLSHESGLRLAIRVARDSMRCVSRSSTTSLNTRTRRFANGWESRGPRSTDSYRRCAACTWWRSTRKPATSGRGGTTRSPPASTRKPS